MGVKDEQLLSKRNRGRGSRQSISSSASDSEFINLELDKEQTVRYREWRDDVINVLDIWTEEIENGYRFSTKYDDYSSSVAAFMFPDPLGPNSGFILTGRGGTAFRALSECLFKHREDLRGEWGNGGRSNLRLDDPDF